MPKKLNMLDSKIMKEIKIKSFFMIYENFASTLMLKNNENQNPNKRNTRKFQKYVKGNINERSYYYITAKNRGLSHKECNIRVK